MYSSIVMQTITPTTPLSPAPEQAVKESWVAHWVNQIRHPSPARVSKVILGLLVVAETLVSIFWIFALSDLGDAYAFMAFFPYAYILVSYVSLLVFYRLKRFEYSTFTQLTMLLVMPFFMQWIIGGFEASSGVAVWAILSPVGALLMLGSRQSTPWFLLFFILVLVSWGMNDLFAGYALPIPKHTKQIFFLTNVSGVASILYFVMRYFESQRSRIMKALEVEQEKSERLLLNIMPKSIADRLKNNEGRIADRYESVTIMFADLVDFTKISAGMPPDELVDMLNLVFSRFDQITEKYGLEKIKTIGDAYMVVGGVPNPHANHAELVTNMAIEMQSALKDLSAESGRALAMRFGINSGTVIAGVIGNKKFSFDLWGDAVNTASRMEQYGVPNRIQVTDSTYQQLKDKFDFEDRGLINVKGKGDVQAYFLLGRKP